MKTALLATLLALAACSARDDRAADEAAAGAGAVVDNGAAAQQIEPTPVPDPPARNRPVEND